jgi:N6-L-threonylcarbamoyladenine synthase
VERRADGSAHILSELVLSQTREHAAFGGVVPEIAARAHIEALDGLIAASLQNAGLRLPDVDAVAATAGPGLIGGLIVGLTTAKAIAFAANKPLVAVNHLEGHALTARLTDGLAFPYLLLLVSGGHSQFLEAFDKAAKLLGLGYPGGPAVEKAAKSGDSRRFDLPRPLLDRPGSDFSFSGLKTALRLAAEAIAPLSDTDVADLCASFQAAVTDVVADRARHAMRMFYDRYQTPGVLVVAGGVAANETIRAALRAEATRHGFRLVAPPARLCADNAVMIAWAGAERLALGLTDPLTVAARPRWPLDSVAPALLGSGMKGAKA